MAYIAPQDRSNWAWAQYNAALPFDAVVPRVAALLRSVRPGVARIMVSGRAEGDWPGDRRRRFLMEDWLTKHWWRHADRLHSQSRDVPGSDRAAVRRALCGR